jgi:glucosylceramidase
MKKTIFFACYKGLLPVVLFCCLYSCGKTQPANTTEPPVVPPGSTKPADVVYWLTKGDQTVLLQKQNQGLLFNSVLINGNPTIVVDTAERYQSVDGFGFALTGGSAYLINRLPDAGRAALLKELFTTDSTFIGINYLRISIGASDLNANVYTYDDVSAGGQPDTALTNFSLGADIYDLVPVLKQIVALNPNIKLLGSPWTAPAWMKTNNSAKGGSLKPEYYGVYAQYFVKYIQAMQALGIRIEAITPQNEPLNPYNNPSMLMQAAEQAVFIKNYLGPAFKAAGITTKIIVYDHNCDVPNYPLSILADPDAYKYIDGSAFHLYAGVIGALTEVHNAYPDKNVYFTEQWVGAPGNFPADLSWHIKNLVIGATRNWSKSVIEWNLASDPNYLPHTQGGCTTCMGALTISSNISRNVSYYVIAHASKFVPSGSVRIASSNLNGLPNVAFQTPSGKKVLIVLNETTDSQSINIQFNNKMVTATLPAAAVGTFVW